jgi:2-keto-4-pentenoate hydratase/2-oxohepta-3-ene-1,7-dioic acid hydratase in catechol pathway
MRIARFEHEGHPHTGVVLGEEIADLGDADPIEILLGRVAVDPAAPRLPLASVRLLPPIAAPRKFLAIGLNYADHCAETGQPHPSFPVFFNKQVTCLTAPGDPIHVPRASSMVDYEGELGVVIGRRCRHVPAERALEVVAGYTIVDDVTVRDWQLRAPTMTIGKSFDTHGPVGPWIVSTDEIPDPQALRIRTIVSGDVLQDAPTSGMIFGVAEQIATLSTSCTLEPGDIIATGTPAGVGIVRQPSRWLVAGDTVRIEIDGIGALENPVIDEPADTAFIA